MSGKGPCKEKQGAAEQARIKYETANRNLQTALKIIANDISIPKEKKGEKSEAARKSVEDLKQIYLEATAELNVCIEASKK